MIKTFFLILFLVCSLSAASWREMRSFNLKKDEVARLIITTSASSEYKRVLTWRWTLYTDKALVVHTKLDRVVGQHILYAAHNDSFRKPFLPSLKSERDIPYALVTFKKFDDQNKTALFDVMIYDKEKRVLIEYLPKEEKK